MCRHGKESIDLEGFPGEERQRVSDAQQEVNSSIEFRVCQVGTEGHIAQNFLSVRWHLQRRELGKYGELDRITGISVIMGMETGRH